MCFDVLDSTNFETTCFGWIPCRLYKPLGRKPRLAVYRAQTGDVMWFAVVWCVQMKCLEMQHALNELLQHIWCRTDDFWCVFEDLNQMLIPMCAFCLQECFAPPILDPCEMSCKFCRWAESQILRPLAWSWPFCPRLTSQMPWGTALPYNVWNNVVCGDV